MSMKQKILHSIAFFHNWSLRWWNYNIGRRRK